MGNVPGQEPEIQDPRPQTAELARVVASEALIKAMKQRHKAVHAPGQAVREVQKLFEIDGEGATPSQPAERDNENKMDLEPFVPDRGPTPRGPTDDERKQEGEKEREEAETSAAQAEAMAAGTGVP